MLSSVDVKKTLREGDIGETLGCDPDRREGEGRANVPIVGIF